MLLIGKPAPHFSANAVVNGTIVPDFSLDQFKGKKYVILFFYPKDFTFVCPTELIGFQEALGEFEKRDVAVVGCSTDSEFSHWAWINTPRSQGGIQGVTYPIVSDINKMFVYFSMNEKQLLALTRQKDGSVNSMIGAMPEVQLQLADGTMYPAKGKIETLSGVIDLSTGAVQMRATFPNAQRLLRSGGTGTVLIPSVLDSALLIPQSATYEVQDKKFVYVLQPDSTLKYTEVKISDLNDGQNYIVTSGLNSSEKIVVEGVQQLHNGQKITPITQAQQEAKYQQHLKDQHDGNLATAFN